MTHLHDKHCNTEVRVLDYLSVRQWTKRIRCRFQVMKQSLTRRKQVSQGGKVEPPPPAPTTHPGYAPDAALHAIKRHALEFVNPKELQVSIFSRKTFFFGVGNVTIRRVDMCSFCK
jgi:AT-rich interactive domain-containing protein 2